MDTLNHSWTGYCITAIPLTLLSVPQPIAVACGIIGGVLSAVPDLVGEWKALNININTRWFKWKKVGDNYAWYDKCHRGEFVYLRYILYIWLHVKLDSWCHGIWKRWYAGKWWEYFVPSRYKERMWMQTTMWLINVVMGVYYIMLLKK
jgi:hypothetical protein